MKRFLLIIALGLTLLLPHAAMAGAGSRPPRPLPAPRLSPTRNLTLKLQGVLDGGIPVDVTGRGEFSATLKIGERDYDGVKYPVLLRISCQVTEGKEAGAFEVLYMAFVLPGAPAKSGTRYTPYGVQSRVVLRPGEPVEVLKTPTAHLTLSFFEQPPDEAPPQAVADAANGGATFRFQGTLPAGAPLDATFTTSGISDTVSVELPVVETDGTKVNVPGQMRVAMTRLDKGFLVNFEGKWNWPPAAGQFDQLMFLGLAFAPPGQPVTVLQVNGASLTLTVTESSENAPPANAAASSSAEQEGKSVSSGTQM